MTGNKSLLDTNIIIDVFDGNKNYADKINNLRGFYISSTILGELYVEIYRVENKTKHLKKLDDFLSSALYWKLMKKHPNIMVKLLPVYLRKENLFPPMIFG
jgi:hypothetical protein